MHPYTQKRLIIRILQLIVLIFLVNWVATTFFWYYTIWWFDIPMHTVGGVFLGLIFGYILLRFGYVKIDFKKFLYGVLFIFIIGVLWEIFEFNIDTFITLRGQNIIDTLSDLCFDLAGGIIALHYVQKYFITEDQARGSDSNLGDTQV